MTSYGGYGPNDPTFVPVAEAAAALGVPAAWLRDEARAGRAPALTAGRRIMVNLEQVRRVLLGRSEAAFTAPYVDTTAPATTVGEVITIASTEPDPDAGRGDGPPGPSYLPRRQVPLDCVKWAGPPEPDPGAEPSP